MSSIIGSNVESTRRIPALATCHVKIVAIMMKRSAAGKAIKNDIPMETDRET